MPSPSDEDLSQRVMAWCRRVPTRYERDDPWADHGFQEAQTGARHSFEDPDTGPAATHPSDLPPRPPARLDFARPNTPMHGSSTSSKALVTSEGARDNAGGTIRKGQKLSKVLGLFSRKPKDAGPASPPPAPPTPPRPVRLNFLFVGSRGTGQTCLLFRSRYGYFPDVHGLRRTMYETYTRERVYMNIPVTVEL
ncbi:hypothetical protein G6O67_007807 [Ophiocordyceps sinensis]|uniref:Uncharacterized protein n=1 Tax=Ophiocordyceps sinensis TaxID=72228 RepID=A0A8H4LVF2_9HYPO|nr:hypothetical protein G6O67_007807 [Ophiocordyceps sinensis]